MELFWLLFKPLAEITASPSETTDPLFCKLPGVVICKSPLACIVPELVNGPLFCKSRFPPLVPMTPVLRTPKPASVPNRNILPAYMPPNRATSRATSGAVPLPTMGATEGDIFADKVVASMVFVPVITLKSLAQMPALT